MWSGGLLVLANRKAAQLDMPPSTASVAPVMPRNNDLAERARPGKIALLWVA
jgi:hypothetical protein